MAKTAETPYEELTPAQKGARTRAANKAKADAKAKKAADASNGVSSETPAKAKTAKKATASAKTDAAATAKPATKPAKAAAAKVATTAATVEAKAEKAATSGKGNLTEDATEAIATAPAKSSKTAAAEAQPAAPQWVGPLGDDDYDEPMDQDALDQEAIDFVNQAVGAPNGTPIATKKKKAVAQTKPSPEANAEREASTETEDEAKLRQEEDEAEANAKANKKAARKAAKALETDGDDYVNLKDSSDNGQSSNGATPKSKAKKAKGDTNVDHLQVDKTKPADDENRPSFASLGLIEPLQRAVADMGFEYPTRIQASAIPHLLERETDLVGLAQTGTGKTAAFGLPALHRLHVNTRVPQVLVLAPTRELCLQITVEMGSFAKHMPNVDIAPVYGRGPTSRARSSRSAAVSR